jgi:ankyrin repeat protein
MSTGRKKAFQAIGAAVVVCVLGLCIGCSRPAPNAVKTAGPEYLYRAIRDGRYDRAVAYVKAGRPLQFPPRQIGPDGKPVWDIHALPQPLVEACGNYRPEFALLLLKNGAKANVVNQDGSTPLHEAVMVGYGRVVKDLIEQGAKVNAVNRDGETPLDKFIENGYQEHETLRLLISHGALGTEQLVKPQDGVFRTVPHTRGADLALRSIAGPFRESDFEWLLKNGANPNTSDPVTGRTPLMAVVQTARDREPQALRIAETLLKHGAKPNSKDAKGRTALYFAANSRFARMAKLLVSYGAGPTAAKRERGVKKR